MLNQLRHGSRIPARFLCNFHQPKANTTFNVQDHSTGVPEPYRHAPRDIRCTPDLVQTIPDSLEAMREKRREDNKFLILGSGMPPRKLPAGRRLPVTNSLSRWLALFVVCSVMCGRGRGVRVIVTPWKKVGPTGDGLWLVSPTEPSVLWQL